MQRLKKRRRRPYLIDWPLWFFRWDAASADFHFTISSDSRKVVVAVATMMAVLNIMNDLGHFFWRGADGACLLVTIGRGCVFGMVQVFPCLV